MRISSPLTVIKWRTSILTMIATSTTVSGTTATNRKTAANGTATNRKTAANRTTANRTAANRTATNRKTAAFLNFLQFAFNIYIHRNIILLQIYLFPLALYHHLHHLILLQYSIHHQWYQILHPWCLILHSIW